jgi:outer membrane protein TolC
MYRSLKFLADAQNAAYRQTKQQILARTRSSYVTLQLAFEQLKLVQEALDLAQRQAKDIQTRFRVGAASRLEHVTAQREVSLYQLQISQAQSSAEEATLNLIAIIGTSAGFDAEVPKFDLDPLSKSLGLLRGIEIVGAPASVEANPQFNSQLRLAESAKQAARSAEAGYWPSVQLQARTSLDYPNGPAIEQIHQTSVGVLLSMPLLDWRRTKGLVAQKRLQADSLYLKLGQLQTDLARDWKIALMQIKHLESQKQIAQKVVLEAEELSRLNYQIYKAGRINFTEVQTSNLRFLESRVTLTRIHADLVNQAIRLRAIAGLDVKTE